MLFGEGLVIFTNTDSGGEGRTSCESRGSGWPDINVINMLISSLFLA